jgi:hypothetical protein
MSTFSHLLPQLLTNDFQITQERLTQRPNDLVFFRGDTQRLFGKSPWTDRDR